MSIEILNKTNIREKYFREKKEENEEFFLDDEFLKRDLSESTKRDYRNTFENFDRWLGHNEPSREQVIEYLIEKRDSGVQNSTLRKYRQCLNIILDLWEQETITNDDFNITRTYSKLEPENILTIEESKNLIKYSTGESKLLNALLVSSGLRIEEGLALTFDCLDLENLTCTVRNGKGEKSRTTIFSKQFKEELIKEKEWLCKTDYKIFNYKYCYFWRKLKEAAKKAGIKKRIHPHLLRHTFATHYYKMTKDPKALQLLLGHATVQQGAVYTHLSFEDIKNVNPMD